MVVYDGVGRSQYRTMSKNTKLLQLSYDGDCYDTVLVALAIPYLYRVVDFVLIISTDAIRRCNQGVAIRALQSGGVFEKSRNRSVECELLNYST